MKRWMAGGALGAALMLAACESDDPVAARADINGTWRGSLDSAAVTLVLTGASNVVSGTGQFRTGNEVVSTSAAGTITDGGSFAITIRPVSLSAPYVYTGTLRDTTMTGVISSNGSLERTLVLKK